MIVPAPFHVAGDHLAIELAGARVVFTTRRGGYSSGPYATLNLGRLTDDEAESVRRNRTALAERLGVSFAYGRQVHGASVSLIREPPERAGAPEQADGQATALRGVAPMVLVADCLPVAVSAAGAVAMLHAGWRGLAAGVLREGVSAVRELGGVGPTAAAIGPGAGPCCYEVGEEVHAAFAARHDAARSGRNLDLKAIARSELEHAGVREVHDVALCTICAEESLFFSHRRDRGVTGRQAGVAWLV